MRRFIFTFLLFGPLFVFAEEPIGKVVDSYIKDDATQMMLETNRTLNTSQTVYLHGGISVTIREVMSISEKEGISYYKAYSPSKVRVLPGENVYLKPPSGKVESKLPEFEKKVLFMKKKYGNVTLVEGDKIMINRGSLHDVDKRDIYVVYGKDKKTKGQIELYGVGDFLSAASSYKSIEYGRNKVEIEPGDEVKFLGNRKVLGLGFMFSRAAGQRTKSIDGDNWENYIVKGGGLLITKYFKHGWSSEWLLGMISKKADPTGSNTSHSRITAPFWVRKSFFYPQKISPFISAGLARYESDLDGMVDRPLTSCEGWQKGDYTPCWGRVTLKKKMGIIPFPGAGVEFFSGETIHLRVDAHYYHTPTIKYYMEGLDGIFRTRGIFLHFGASMNW